MTNRELNIESMVFDTRTTYNAEYRDQGIPPIVKTLYKDKKHSPKDVEVHVRYIHTMMYWTPAPAPFDTMISRKQVVRTNPHEVQAPYEKPPDLELDEVRRHRPRLVMTPAVSMDEVDDDLRDMLLKDNYSSTFTREFGNRGELSKIKAPLRGKYACASPLGIEKYKQASVPAEWRKDSLTWDRRQLRSCCNATQVFWLRGKQK